MSKEDVHVSIQSVLRVPLVMPMLDSIDDGALRKEIAEEAVRLSVMESLGGFNGVTVVECPTATIVGTDAKPTRCQYNARVDFNHLSRCIGALQSEHERVIGIARDMHEVVRQMTPLASAELQSALRTFEDGLKNMLSPPAESNEDDLATDGQMEMPTLVGSKEEGRGLLDDTDDDGEDGLADPEAAGYTRMSDD